MSNEQLNDITNNTRNKEFPFQKKEKTISIIEYAENQMATFDQLPFGPVDSLVLSQLAYMNLGCIVPAVENDDNPVFVSDLYKAEHFTAILDNVRDAKSNRKLLNAVCASPRYRNIRINYFIDNIDEHMEKQFCAMTFILPSNQVYVAYRGTDSTIVGWKEDFNMFFRSVIPGQISAVHYLQTVAARLGGDIYVGGHSKGGNLALFAGAFAPQDIRDRLITVFNHDGPGLSPEIQNLSEYNDVSEKVQTTVPQASLFGLIFSSGEHKVVKSDRMGIMQHDPFSWEIKEDDFVYSDELKTGANKIVFTMYDLMNTLAYEDREVFIDTIFRIIASPGVSSFTEWPAMAIKEMDTIIATFKNIEPEVAEKMKTVAKELVKALGKNMINIPQINLPDVSGIKDFITEKVSGINLPKKQ